MGEEDIKIEDSLTVSGGTYTYKDVKVTDGAIVTLSDSVTLLCDKFEVTGNSRVSINGKLVVYCNELKVSGDAEINVTGESRNLIFFVKDKAKIEGSANLICILYSPEGEIEIKGTLNVTGQIVAKEVEIKGNAEIEQRISFFGYFNVIKPESIFIISDSLRNVPITLKVDMEDWYNECKKICYDAFNCDPPHSACEDVCDFICFVGAYIRDVLHD